MNTISKVKELLNINKFSFSQLTSNSDGKTSMSGTMGGLICTASAIGFIWGAFSKQSDLITQAVAYALIGAGLLGYRKSKDSTILTPLSEDSDKGSSDISETSPNKQEIPTKDTDLYRNPNQ
jgi:hypothetical protein